MATRFKNFLFLGGALLIVALLIIGNAYATNPVAYNAIIDVNSTTSGINLSSLKVEEPYISIGGCQMKNNDKVDFTQTGAGYTSDGCIPNVTQYQGMPAVALHNRSEYEFRVFGETPATQIEFVSSQECILVIGDEELSSAIELQNGCYTLMVVDQVSSFIVKFVQN